ncbi:helix-turn-helix transcriptional regulator [Rhodococcus opacus]|nr:helix-turn-helix transcriptional regulator [Rhodococcus opacus]
MPCERRARRPARRPRGASPRPRIGRDRRAPGTRRGAILDLSPTAVSNASAALGHPTRLEIVRTLLPRSRRRGRTADRGRADLAGQLYHHLRALSGARIVEQESRNHYPDVGEHPL